MKNFINWGIRIRKDLSRNYYSVWENLKTTRLDLGEEIKLPYDRSEFNDVGITERCNLACQYCYVSADNTRQDYKNICETWKSWMASFPEDKPVDLEGDEIFRDIIAKPEKTITQEELIFKYKVHWYLKNKFPVVYTEKMMQVAIGSVGSPTIHPDFPEFLQTVYETRVVPNYTTNGLILASNTSQSEKILEATRNFVGGVAVSYGNKSVRTQADKAIEKLLTKGDCKVMIHHLISDKASVDELLEAEDKWGKDIHYHVLLPLKRHGRSDKEMTEEAYLYLVEKIKEKNYDNLAFGMWFLPWMKKYPGSINCWDYPGETYSSNLLLKDGKVLITPSSYNLEVVKEISMEK